MLWRLAKNPPNKKGRYLVYVKHRDTIFGSSITLADYYIATNTRAWAWSVVMGSGSVTHWMPLPKEPTTNMENK